MTTDSHICMASIISLTELLQLQTILTIPNIGLDTAPFIEISNTILESVSESDLADLDSEFHGHPMNSYMLAFFILVQNLTKAPVSVENFFENPDPVPERFRKSQFLFFNTMLRVRALVQNERHASELQTWLDILQNQFKSKSVVNV